MLEIRHVTKKYLTKGVSVTALNDVSVTFPEKGMVFLVGKSGSGKSTLLNISGGLDSPDQGEVILKGKSSKDFTEADFDSYRNTYIGFIFQEFNVLNEYTVEENISLALELQGKPSDKQKVTELLEQVDLAGFAKRKPNTLSGGQKQRVAIARALVKNPEIIMADEPTGSLDSGTGKQVFDALKKLSEEKLVVIVSHDRDSADRYADRIIELRDGNIISDITKDKSSGAENKVSAENDTLYIVPDEPLSAEDIRRAADFFSSPSTEKKVSIKTDTGGGSFSATDLSSVDNNVYDGSDVNFIKSHLSVKHAVRMGASGLKVKPIRLVFTVLLSTIAFIIFGLFSTLLTYNKTAVIAQKLVDEQYTAAILDKNFQVTIYEYRRNLIYNDLANYTLMYTDEDVLRFSSDYGLAAVGVNTFNHTSSDYFTLRNNIDENYTQDSLTLYFSENNYVNGFCDLEDKNLSDYGLTLVAGKYPTGDDEIAITTYQYELLKQGGFYPYADRDSLEQLSKVELTSYDDVLNYYVSVCKYATTDTYFNVKIVGVVDCGEIPSKYDVLKLAHTDNQSWLRRELTGYDPAEVLDLYDDFLDYYLNSFHSVIFVGSAFFEGNSEQSLYMLPTNERIAEFVAPASIDDVMTTAEYEALEKGTDSGKYYVTDYDVAADTEVGEYLHLMIYIKNNSSAIEKLVQIVDKGDGVAGVEYELDYDFIYEANSAQKTVDQILNIFLAAGVGLAIFAALMLSNFIAASINGKEKDIGILRAVGARGSDIFKIFITEALIITLSCFAIASFASLGVCAIVNHFIMEAGVTTLSLFIFTFPDVLMIFAIAIISAFAATSFPVKKTVSKKPVEAIRSL